jgi:hypothetical protein
MREMGLKPNVLSLFLIPDLKAGANNILCNRLLKWTAIIELVKLTLKPRATQTYTTASFKEAVNLSYSIKSV